MRQKCGAERPALRPSGWECLGVGLVVVMRGPKGVPTVVPAVLLNVISHEVRQLMEREGGPRPFTGGDHLHLVLTGRPDAETAIRTSNLRLL